MTPQTDLWCGWIVLLVRIVTGSEQRKYIPFRDLGVSIARLELVTVRPFDLLKRASLFHALLHANLITDFAFPPRPTTANCHYRCPRRIRVLIHSPSLVQLNCKELKNVVCLAGFESYVSSISCPGRIYIKDLSSKWWPAGEEPNSNPKSVISKGGEYNGGYTKAGNNFADLFAKHMAPRDTKYKLKQMLKVLPSEWHYKSRE